MVAKKTLEEYHKVYPERAGDTAEKFHKYELFCEQNQEPRENQPLWFEWYAKLARHMESK